MPAIKLGGEDIMNKVAILIDGGFYLKQLPHIRKDVDLNSPEKVVDSIRQLVRGHLEKLSQIQGLTLFDIESENSKFAIEPDWYAQHYRTFYYDARPFKEKSTRPISKNNVDFSKTVPGQFRLELFNMLRRQRNLALRLGETKPDPDYLWQIRPKVLKDLVNNKKKFSALTDEDFIATIRQKGVDMRMGLDMASIALKGQANIFVLVTGDADFVPAAKLIRREGCQVILDPLHRNVSPELFEHIDWLHSAFSNPKKSNNSRTQQTL
jgi:uncharacterized LabA/DUF88 family protein